MDLIDSLNFIKRARTPKSVLVLDFISTSFWPYQAKYIVSWEPEGRYQYSKIFRWEPEGRYGCTMSMAAAPFWFSMEHLWIVIAPFWLSTDNIWYSCIVGACNQTQDTFLILYELKFSRWFYFREFRESNPRENFHFNLCLFIVMTTSAKSRN